MSSADFSLMYFENHPVGQSDFGLVMAARKGSDAAFAELHRLYAHRLYKKIFSITRNHEDSEDVLQETLMRAYFALASFEGRSQFLSWLTRIAINTSLGTLRKRRARREADFEFLAHGEDEAPQYQVEDPSPNPEEICIQLERSLRTLNAIDQLKPSLRSVLQTQIGQDCSLLEIARSLGVSVATVKSRLYRGRRRLAKRLSS